MAPASADVAGGDGLTPGGGEEDEVRRRVFRLGWDLAASGFAGRQYLFEQFNGRDLTRNRQAFIERYDLEGSQSLARRIALGD
jgi:aromatic ring hydroxylase